MSASIDASTPVVLLKLYHHGAVGAIRSLGRLGVPVYGTHERRDAPAARSRYLRELLVWNVDTAPAEASVQFLLEAAGRFDRRPLLIASDDASAMLVADHQATLSGAFTFPIQPEGLPQALYSKRGMFELCRRHEIPTPDTNFPTSRGDVEAFAARTQFPVVVKAMDSHRMQMRSKETMRIVGGPREMLEAYDELEDPARPNVMLQEYIPGDPSTVWMFDGYFDERSACRFSGIGRKLRQHPPATGMASLGACEHNATVDGLTRRFMRELGYRGILDCGYRWDARDGLYKLLDVNPRLGATFRLFVGAGGLDVVRALYLDLTGQAVPRDGVPDGRTWLVEDYDVTTTARLLRARQPLDVRRWARSVRDVDEVAWLARDDPRPFLGMTAALAARAGRRAVQPLR